MPRKTNDFGADLPRFHRALHAWYAKHGRRDLPWRTAPDAYPVYISEIMLQQTQVKTVLERYYGPFLKKFPTLAALAKAKTEEVVKQWEGLGYYTRARNLHAAAQQSKGMLPNTVEALLALPGIGRNTAHAVACFGFGLAVPIMEANVKRVLCRIFALEIPDDKTLWEKAAFLLDAKNPFDYNQAMMDIGAMVCTPRSPRCNECPANIICKGQTSPESYPQKKAKKKTPVRKRRIVVFTDGKGRYLLSRRNTRFLGGLYGFPEFETDEIRFLGKSYRLTDTMLLGGVTQVYSHFTLEAKVYLIAFKGRLQLPEGTRAVALADIEALPLSGVDHKVLKLIKI